MVFPLLKCSLHSLKDTEKYWKYWKMTTGNICDPAFEVLLAFSEIYQKIIKNWNYWKYWKITTCSICDPTFEVLLASSEFVLQLKSNLFGNIIGNVVKYEYFALLLCYFKRLFSFQLQHKGCVAWVTVLNWRKAFCTEYLTKVNILKRILCTGKYFVKNTLHK